MPKSLQINVAEPCHENWQNMTPQQQGRFCGACRKNVVDFTMMSDQEVLNYFLKADHSVCGRFADDQLNKELKVTEKKKRFSWAYVWNILVATFLITKADAQVKVKPKKPVEVVNEDRQIMGMVAYKPPVKNAIIPVEIKGRVVDEQSNEPVMFATIRVKDREEDYSADNTGNFSLKVKKKDKVMLEISAVGYETQTKEIEANSNWGDIQISLKRAYAALNEVSVIAYGTTTTRRCHTLGGASSVVSYTNLEKMQRNINDWMPAALKKDVKVYPNPVVRGYSLQVSLSLKQAGAYKLEVLNAAGQVMQVQPLLMQTKEQLIDLHTQEAWSAGIYWIRISSTSTKSVYNSKVIVQ